jgi:hypothetical protein
MNRPTVSIRWSHRCTWREPSDRHAPDKKKPLRTAVLQPGYPAATFRATQGTIYRGQCADVLQRIRLLKKWSSCHFRQTAIRAGFFGVRKIEGLLRQCCGYHGNRIVRKSAGSDIAHWEIERYRLP